MININDLKTGITLVIEGNLFTVIEFLHVKPGKGPAFVRTKLRNVRTNAIIERTFNSGIRVETANIDRQDMQFLYSQGDSFNFMNMSTYEQIEINKNNLGDDYLYLKEGLEVTIPFYEGEVLGLILPDKIEMVVTETEPGVKGNTINNTMKDAVVETGLKVRIPLFINEGESIIISTKDGKYSSRA